MWRVFCPFVMWLVGSLTTAVCDNGEPEVTLHRDVPAELLSCWTCRHSSEKPNTNCVHMVNKTEIQKTKCHLYESFCRIRRLTDDDRVDSLERTCTDSCNPGCHRINKLDTCEWCCTQPLCNIGSQAPGLINKSEVVYMVFITVVTVPMLLQIVV